MMCRRVCRIHPLRTMNIFTGNPSDSAGMWCDLSGPACDVCNNVRNLSFNKVSCSCFQNSFTPSSPPVPVSPPPVRLTVTSARPRQASLTDMLTLTEAHRFKKQYVSFTSCRFWQFCSVIKVLFDAGLSAHGGCRSVHDRNNPNWLVSTSYCDQPRGFHYII